LPTNLKARAPAWAACIVALAAALRLIPFLARPLWYDEIFTVWAARLAPSRLIEVLRLDSGPPLFYLLCRPLVLAAERLHGSDLLARLPSLAAGLAVLLAAAALPERDSRLRFLALAAVSPLLILYAAEARPYALLGLEGLVLFLLVLRAPQTRGRLAGAAALSAAALYTHYLALFLVAALAVVALARGRRRPAGALLAGAVLFTPWLQVLGGQPAAATAWMQEPLSGSVAGFLSTLGGAGRLPVPFGEPLPAMLVWAGAAIGILATAGLASAPAQSAARDAGAVSLLALLAILAAGALRPIAFAGRSELAVLPIWLWGLAEASTVSRLARAAAAAVAVASAIACVLALAGLPREAPGYSDFASRLAREARAGDVVFAGGSFYLPARLAADRGALPSRLFALPAALESHPGWIPAMMPGPDEISLLARETRALAPPARAWLLLPRLFATPRLFEAFAGGAEVSVLVDRPDAILIVR
jgi:hypothetical protein